MHDQTGHRQRIRDRFKNEGLDSFDEVHALELLLTYAIPRIDTKPLARRLLDRFGSYPAVLEATKEELLAVEGIGESSAVFLQLLNAAGRYYMVRKDDAPTILGSAHACGEYLKRFYYGRRNETIYMLCLDAKCRMLACHMVGEGDVNSVNIPTRKLVELALSTNATTVVLAHSHPGGLALPSAEDVAATYKLSNTLASIGVILADHLVMCEDDWTSMVQSGAYRRPQI